LRLTARHKDKAQEAASTVPDKALPMAA